MNSSPRSEVKLFFRYGQIGIVLLLATILFAGSGGKARAESIEADNNSRTIIQVAVTPKRSCSAQVLTLQPGGVGTHDFGVMCTISSISLSNRISVVRGGSSGQIDCTLLYSGMTVHPNAVDHYDNPPGSHFSWSDLPGDITGLLSLTCKDR